MISLPLANTFLHYQIPNAAYIHIPFCRRRCYYCDFPISVVGDRYSLSYSSMVIDYVEFLCQEIKTISNPTKKLTTVFFGGGTPSLLPVNFLEKILIALDEHIGIDFQAEISLEIDPGTFDREKLQGYLAAGVNRISLGVQAFQDELLQICGRSHSRKDIFEALQIIEQVGVDNFSLDLISGLPQQTITQWQDSLTEAIAIAPHHLSCYDLVLEPVTVFGKKYQPGTKPLPTDETTAQMYRLAQQMLTSAGYEHYEISNYARSGYQCRHNRVYWQNQPYYGFGMGAASYFDGKRFTRCRTRKEYYAWVQQGAPIMTSEISSTDYLLETLMLGFRLAEGINLDSIRQQFGKEIIEQIWACLQPYYQCNWLEIIDKTGAKIKTNSFKSLLDKEIRLKLADPEGFLFSNTILTALFQQFS